MGNEGIYLNALLGSYLTGQEASRAQESRDLTNAAALRRLMEADAEDKRRKENEAAMVAALERQRSMMPSPMPTPGFEIGQPVLPSSPGQIGGSFAELPGAPSEAIQRRETREFPLMPTEQPGVAELLSPAQQAKIAMSPQGRLGLQALRETEIAQGERRRREEAQQIHEEAIKAQKAGDTLGYYDNLAKMYIRLNQLGMANEYHKQSAKLRQEPELQAKFARDMERLNPRLEAYQENPGAQTLGAVIDVGKDMESPNGFLLYANNLEKAMTARFQRSFSSDPAVQGFLTTMSKLAIEGGGKLTEAEVFQKAAQTNPRGAGAYLSDAMLTHRPASPGVYKASGLPPEVAQAIKDGTIKPGVAIAKAVAWWRQQGLGEPDPHDLDFITKYHEFYLADTRAEAEAKAAPEKSAAGLTAAATLLERRIATLQKMRLTGGPMGLPPDEVQLATIDRDIRKAEADQAALMAQIAERAKVELPSAQEPPRPPVEMPPAGVKAIAKKVVDQATTMKAKSNALSAAGDEDGAKRLIGEVVDNLARTAFGRSMAELNPAEAAYVIKKFKALP